MIELLPVAENFIEELVMLGLDVVEIPVSNAELNVEELNSRLSEVDEEVDRES